MTMSKAEVGGRTPEPVGRMAERQKGFRQTLIGRQNPLPTGHRQFEGRFGLLGTNRIS